MLLLSALLFGAAGTIHAQEPDADGCRDHPMFSRMPDFYIGACQDQEFGAWDFTLDDGTTTPVEGHFVEVEYWIQEGHKHPGPLQIGRNYLNVMTPRGGTRVLEDLDSSGGTMTARMPGPEGSGAIWLEVSVSNAGETYTLRVVQEAGMRQDVTFTARELADTLAATGQVTLRNILFDTGKATLLPASTTALTAVVELMKADPALTLEIQGHTDSTGTPEGNLTLSRARADAVKAHLVAAGIDAARLTTAGFGDTKPVADNTTEEGRAQNRRVVLLKKG
ncbi:MAG: OmpA family protein [Vicinamibacterales bacterium]